MAEVYKWPGWTGPDRMQRREPTAPPPKKRLSRADRVITAVMVVPLAVCICSFLLTCMIFDGLRLVFSGRND